MLISFFCYQIIPVSAPQRQARRNPVNPKVKTSQAGTTDLTIVNMSVKQRRVEENQTLQRTARTVIQILKTAKVPRRKAALPLC